MTNSEPGPQNELLVMAYMSPPKEEVLFAVAHHCHQESPHSWAVSHAGLLGTAALSSCVLHSVDSSVTRAFSSVTASAKASGQLQHFLHSWKSAHFLDS